VNRFFRSALFPLFVIVLLVYLASQTLIPHGKNTQKLTLSQFTQHVQDHDVQSAEFNPSKRAISFKLNDGKKGTVHYPSDQSAPFYTNLMQQNGVQFDSKGTGSWSWIGFFTSLLPFVLLFAFWIFLMNQVQGGGSKVMSFGKSRAKRMAPD
jgi:cell division protease FtsH